MRGSVEKSLKDFDDGLEKYFATTRKYKSSLRRGSIVLLDKNDKLFKFFKFLSDKCGLELGVMHVMEDSSAKKAIEDLSSTGVKAVVVDCSMLGDSLNGDSLISWLAKENPSIPIWVVNCGNKQKEWIRSQSIKIGVIEEDSTLKALAETVGFPKECENFIHEYA
jgi:DNA-binding NarL/FixJ family response regulator